MKKFLMGMVVGLVSGTVLGILLAPKSGKETRKEIVNYMSEIKKKINEKMSSLKNLTKEKYAQIIDSTVGEYQDEDKIDREEAVRLKNELLSKYKKIEDILE